MENSEKKIIATVKSPARDAHLRKGKGYSLSEINAAGKSVSLLKELNIKIDYFRKSAHKSNIEQLKALKTLKKKGKKRKPYVPKEKRIKAKPKVKKKVVPVKKVEVVHEEPEAVETEIEELIEEPIEEVIEKSVKVVKEVKKVKKVKEAKVKAKVKPKEKHTPLTKLSRLGPATAKKLADVGVDSVELLITEDPNELSMLLTGISEERIAKWIDEGKELLNIKD